jgi:HlyD family secretion protein
MNNIWKRAFYAALGLGLLALLVLALMPKPLAVELATVEAGTLQVTVDEDGETRARDRYVVAAPAAGRVSRIDLRDGDAVAQGQPVAELWPLPLSSRERAEQLARIAAAEAALREAQSRSARSEADLAQRKRERVRTDELVSNRFVSPQAAEQARSAETLAAEEAAAAKARVRAAAADLEAARAALLAIDAGRAGGAVTIRAPVAGRVLRIPERSERVVVAGTGLMTLGDPARLEVVVDVLSQDAVKVRPGMPVLLEGWGGPKALRAQVRTVEPFAFTKVSALGVEEQRANIVADFVDPPGALGDGYRVEARIVVWSAENVLKVPASALFRQGEKWAAFVSENGRARLRQVEVGQRSALEAQILDGLKAGEQVVRHPSNTIEDGTRVVAM